MAHKLRRILGRVLMSPRHKNLVKMTQKDKVINKNSKNCFCAPKLRPLFCTVLDLVDFTVAFIMEFRLVLKENLILTRQKKGKVSLLKVGSSFSYEALYPLPPSVLHFTGI